MMEPQVAAKIHKYRRAVIRDAGSPEAWGRLGMVFQAHGLEVEATECYTRASELDTEEFRWTYLLANTLADRNTEQALTFAERASQLRPSYAPAHVLVAQLLERHNRPESALERYKKAVASDPRCTVAEFGLGRLYLANRDLEVSLEHLRRAAELQPDATPINAFLARVYRRLDDPASAEREVELARQPTKEIVLNDPLMAQVMHEAVSSAAYHRGAMRADAAGDLKNAEALYRSLLEIRPLDVVIHYQLGNMLARQGKFPQARDQYRKALDVDLRHAPTLVAFGNMLNYQGKFDEAVRQYRNALDVRPEDTVTRNNLANVLAKKGELEQARAHYQKSLEYEPGNFDAHHNLGQVLARQGKIEQAIAHYRSALRSKQNVGLVHSHLALALVQAGDYRSAWKHAELAQSLGETVPADILEALEQRMQDPTSKRP